MNAYFPVIIKVPFQSSHFPLCSKFEMTLFISTPLVNDAHHNMAKIHNGAYNHWTSAIIHVAGMSRLDLCYSARRLSGYDASATMATCYSLRHCICFLYHHPYVLIMYKRGSCIGKALK